MLTNLEVLTHLQTLQTDLDYISTCRKYNISRQIWRERGKSGQPPDVPTYEDEVEPEIDRLIRVKERRRIDRIKKRQEDRRKKAEASEKEYKKEHKKWEEECEKLQAAAASAPKKRGAKKAPAVALPPEPQRPGPLLSPELDNDLDLDSDLGDEDDMMSGGPLDHESVLKRLKDNEQYNAVRPVPDALRYITDGVSTVSPCLVSYSCMSLND